MTPSPQITAAAVGSALAIIVAWVVSVATSLDPPAAVVAAFTTLCTLGAGYIKGPPAG